MLLTRLMYDFLLSTFVAVVLSSDNLLLIILRHDAVTSLSVWSFPQIVLSHRSVQIRYADSDIRIF